MRKELGQEVKVTKAAVAKVVGQEELSKSARMKELFDMGLPIKEIAAVMDVRYNFAYNVITNYANMNGIKIQAAKKTGKKDLIIKAYLEGKTNKEISIELKTNYNYVFNVLKAYKAEHEKGTEGEAK